MDKALGSSRIDCEFSGSTSVVSFLKGKTLTTAWVGDSRGVLGRSKAGGGYEAVPLTKDHKPTAPEEKARIVATNGRVERCRLTTREYTCPVEVARTSFGCCAVLTSFQMAHQGCSTTLFEITSYRHSS